MSVETAAPSRRRRLAVVGGIAVVLLALLVLAARWFRGTEVGSGFIDTYPGEVPLPEGAPTGFPAWLAWQHFLNAFLMVLIIRSAWLVRSSARPPAYFTRANRGIFKTSGTPKKISIYLWCHLLLDTFWLANGAMFMVLLFATGQWNRIVPTSWDFVPNALSAALQYASLDWPHENGWVNYNSLQVIAYFSVVFIAAPLAALSGVRMSGAWPAQARINRIFPLSVARAVHFPVMVYFVAFIVIHVALVFTTGAMRNLNHMYAAQDSASSWLGFIMFAASLVLIVAAWLAMRPAVLAPVASVMGKVTNR